MKRTIVFFSMLLTAFISINAQHPRVCDYVSLKHALKGREIDFMTPGPYTEGVVQTVKHSKKEIRIGVINEYGKEIDSLNIINYKNDTVYIYTEDSLVEELFAEIKTNKGAFRIHSLKDSTLFFKPIEINVHVDEDTYFDPTFSPGIYPEIFEWNGLEKLIKDKAVEHTAEKWCSLTRLILNEYRLTHIDRWVSRIFIGSLKRDAEICKKNGWEIKFPAEYEIVHIYDTISKKDNDDYLCIMYEDENIPPTRFKKGTSSFNLAEFCDFENFSSKNKVVGYLYKEPNECSEIIVKVDHYYRRMAIYDIIGLWYYVKYSDSDGKQYQGWTKLKTPPFILYPTEE